MRINDSLADEEQFLHGYTFPQWVLALGDGCLKTRSFRQDTPADWMQIPQVFLVDHGGDPIESLATDIYDSFAENYKNPLYLANRAVVTPTNATVSEFNKYMLEQVPDPGKTYYSSDSLLQTTETVDSFEECYPTEFLNSLTFNGIPDHELTLKIHTPVMLLRNISLGLGLCNGTRVMITSLGNDIIKGTIMGGFGDTDEVIIPRIVLNVENPKWPFTLKRRQFPI
ncbi:unnamed protein product [Linum tenue]|uniref:DNA helicase Pif1-like 2B domain-containing protein n=1 Tax=Linum tenue TaxID=586396 RepID=A0AAV0NXU8_9ROSI|nr:unnamed protein product [Linum tenue]